MWGIAIGRRRSKERFWWTFHLPAVVAIEDVDPIHYARRLLGLD